MSISWRKCTKCKVEVSYLSPNDGICMDCLTADKNMILKKKLEITLVGEKAFEEFTFEKFVVTDGNRMAYDACKNFDSNKDNLYIWGQCGNGKTHLAYATIRKKIIKGENCLIYKVPKLFWILRSLNRSEEIPMLDKLCKSPVLVLDDIGSGTSSFDFLAMFLYELIDERIMKKRNGLIFTSNLPLEDLARKLDDDRLVSRIFYLSKEIKITDTDWRVKTKKLSG